MFSLKWRLGGAQLAHHKATTNSETQLLPTPEKVILPMVQHIGRPCEPTVKVGDHVEIGDIVGDSSEYLSAPIHASVSGTVSEIREFLTPNSIRTKAVVITSDQGQTYSPGLRPLDPQTPEEFAAAVRASGLVGLGGAGFPTHVKLSPSVIPKIDTLLVNSAECEPYITSDYRECVEYPDDVLGGIELIRKFFQLKQVFIGIEDNKPAAIALFREKCAGTGIEVKVLKSRYPQGAEKVLIFTATRRIVPQGKLPADVGVLVMNITSLATLYRYFQTGVPLVAKRLTVDGDAVAEPKNVMVPIGTPISDLISFCGGYKTQPQKILMGGPMMGTALYSDELPVLKNNNALLALADSASLSQPATACIRCSSCINACPLELMPTVIEHDYKKGDIPALQKDKVMLCMECGSCSYVCPAKRPLLETNRLAKKLVRKAT